MFPFHERPTRLVWLPQTDGERKREWEWTKGDYRMSRSLRCVLTEDTAMVS